MYMYILFLVFCVQIQQVITQQCAGIFDEALLENVTSSLKEYILSWLKQILGEWVRSIPCTCMNRLMALRPRCLIKIMSANTWPCQLCWSVRIIVTHHVCTTQMAACSTYLRSHTTQQAVVVLIFSTCTCTCTDTYCGYMYVVYVHVLYPLPIEGMCMPNEWVL